MTELGLEGAWERAKLLKDWRSWADRIAVSAREVLAGSLKGVYVFGSVVRGEAVAASDVDLLVVAEALPDNQRGRSELKYEILRGAGLPDVNPFQIHLVDEREAEAYLRHTGRSILRIDGSED
ncbi:MAG: nucleotidyltransferase domain-containing protein [Candidatus Bathyarchaeia archaeon]